MHAPVGASLQIVMLLSELTFDLTAEGLTQAWRWWNGSSRGARKLAQLEQHGFISVDAGGRDRIVRLTDTGRLEALGGRDPARQWSRPWDGGWRVVLFDVPEHEEALRVKLRRSLRAHSFGYLQDSVWISPDSAAVLRAALAGVAVEAERLTLFDARPCGGEANEDLVRGAWDFGRINRRYTAYCDWLRQHPVPTGRTAASRAASARWLSREWLAWNVALRADPLLPDALLPADYPGKQAWALRMKTLRALPIAAALRI
jgi:phenylacetic acid degradation operon negative regulatory protein